MKIKRLLSLLLCCALLCSLAPAFADVSDDSASSGKSVYLSFSNKDRLYTFGEEYNGLVAKIDTSSIYCFDPLITPKLVKGGICIPANFVGYFVTEFYENAGDAHFATYIELIIPPAEPVIRLVSLSCDRCEIAWKTVYGATAYYGELYEMDTQRRIEYFINESIENFTFEDLEPGTRYMIKMVAAFEGFGSETIKYTFTTPKKIVPNIPVSSFKVGKLFTTKNYAGKTIKMYRTQKEQLRVFGVKPADATNPQFIWKSMNPNIVAVKNGLLWAKKLGTTTIKVKAVGTNVVLSFKVTVVKP